MIQLTVYLRRDIVVWRLAKFRPAHEWRSLGPTYWERRGEASLDGPALSDREVLDAALRALLARLGER